MDREDEMVALAARQRFNNGRAAARAAVSLSKYRDNEPYRDDERVAPWVVNAFVHLAVDVLHLGYRDDEPFHLAEIVPAAERIFRAERLRAQEDYLERTEPDEEGGSSPADPQ